MMKSLQAILKMTFLVYSISFLHPNVSAQPSENGLNRLLKSYYAIKESLVDGNNEGASQAAQTFVKNLNGISYQLISEGNVAALEKDASAIAKSKDINVQRKYFSNFSSNMVEVAKALELSDNPVYIQYCPMKKAYWLSENKAIRNPYYGSAMLTCGEVKETIN